MRHLTLIITTLLIISLSGCSFIRFPGVHRITIQQGNVVSLAMVDKLKPGMTKSQVRFVLGNPVIDDPLDSEQWDYIYSISVAGGRPIQRSLILYFIDERLSHFEGDYAPSDYREDS